MPRNTDSSSIAEAVAEALAEGRHTADGLVLTGATARVEGEHGGSVYAQNLSPLAGQEGRAAGILRAAEAAGLLAEGFSPRVVRNLTTGDVVEVLTEQQRKVLTCAARGLSYTETAEALHMAVSTVKGHVGAYYKRLGVHTVPEAVVAAIRCGALPRSVLTGEADPTPEQDTPGDTPAGARSPRVQCSAEGCTKRVRHSSGLCPAHRS